MAPESGPLSGVRVLELAGIGALPYAAMMLADAGADVLRIDRVEGGAAPGQDDLIQRGRRGSPVLRGRRSLAVDLKTEAGRALVLQLAERAEIMIESFRPGVVERLGIGPEECMRLNPALVYGRLSGWGQSGELAGKAGHDINYIAMSGTLSMIGTEGGPPVVPLNLLADFGGGGMLLAFGVLAALVEARATGRGQVVDAAMVDGAASLATYIHGMRAAGTWVDRRASNVLDGGAPFYAVYASSDGEYFAVGAIERQFWLQLLDGLGLDDSELPPQLDRTRWPELRAVITRAFASHPGSHWRDVFSERDACVTPVLSASEAPGHPHLRGRETFVEWGGVVQPAPVPRFRGPATQPRTGEGLDALTEWGIDPATVEGLF